MVAGRKTLLTPELQKEICDKIREGCFEWVAAVSCGISHGTFHQWMQRGNGTHPTRPADEKYVEFVHEVEKARAEARHEVESLVRISNPEFWLRNGPGKSRGGREGWTDETKTEISGPNGGPVVNVEFSNAEDALTYLREIADRQHSPNTEPEE